MRLPVAVLFAYLLFGLPVMARAEVDHLTPEQWQVVSVLDHYAREYAIPPDELISVAYCESRFNPNAIGRQGERGIMQLHPKGLLVSFYAIGYTDPHDVWQAAEFGALAFSRGMKSHWSCAR